MCVCDVQIVLEEVPVGGHAASGLVESAIKNAQGQFRAIRDAAEIKSARRADGEHRVATRMATHAASVVSRGRKDEEGLSAHWM